MMAITEINNDVPAIIKKRMSDRTHKEIEKIRDKERREVLESEVTSEDRFLLCTGKNNILELLQDKVISIDKYRSVSSRVNGDYDKARVILDLTFPEDLPLYYSLKGIKNNDD